MDKKISEEILRNLKDTDKVLDIGGWALPFNRANYIVDIMPYESRGFFGSYGGIKSFFQKILEFIMIFHHQRHFLLRIMNLTL